MWPAFLQHLHHRVAAHEVADPDIGHEQHRPLVCDLRCHVFFDPRTFARTKSCRFPPLNSSARTPAACAACKSLSLSPIRTLFSRSTGHAFMRSRIMPGPGLRQSDTRLNSFTVPSAWNGQYLQSSICAPPRLNSSAIKSCRDCISRSVYSPRAMPDWFVAMKT